MKQRLKFVWKLVRDTYLNYTRDNAARLAAAIAFYAIFSVAPLFIIATAIAGFVLGDRVAHEEIAGYLGQLTNYETQQYILELVSRWQNTSTGVVATVIGIGTLLWGAYRLFMALQDTLNMIWNVRQRRGLGVKTWIRARLVPFGMVLFIGLLLLTSMLATAVLSAMERFFSDFFTVPSIVINTANFAISFAVIAAAFAAAFKILPDVEIEWHDVGMGATLTAFLFVVGKSLIGLYLGHTTTTSIFGAAGSLVALLFWVYFSAQIFFLGAEFTQVFARNTGKRIQPDPTAVRIEQPSSADRAAAPS